MQKPSLARIAGAGNERSRGTGKMLKASSTFFSFFFFLSLCLSSSSLLSSSLWGHREKSFKRSVALFVALFGTEEMAGLTVLGLQTVFQHFVAAAVSGK